MVLETQDDFVMTFRIKLTTKMKHVMEAMSYHLGSDTGELSFKIDGQYIHPAQSVESVG